MRTTLTLEPDVVRMVEDEVHRRRKSFKQVVNEAIRRGLAPAVAMRRTIQPYREVPHQAKLRAGFDRAGFNKLLDELEDEAVLAKRARRGNAPGT